jgi:SET domain-containing protein
MLTLFNQSKIHQATGIEIKQSPLHGRGVFATQRIKPGAVIEIAPLILLETADKEFLQTTSLFSYYFLIDNEDTPAALGLGNSSLYNHSYSANAVYTISLKDACLVIKACKEIKPGDEITLNYNGKPDDTTHVYFQPEPI